MEWQRKDVDLDKFDIKRKKSMAEKFEGSMELIRRV